MAEIPVFSMVDARKMKKNLALPSQLEKDDPSANHALMLVAKTTVEHPQGETHDVELVLGTKGSEGSVIRTAPAFNRSSGTLASGTRVIVTNVNKGLEIIGGTGGTSTSSESCPCTCLPSGDIIVNGIETTSLWDLKFGTEIFRQSYGFISFPAGTYTVVYDGDLGYWTLDIGDYLIATWNSGTDATADTTMDGTLVMSFDSYGNPQIQLCIDGTVPEQP